MLAILGFFSAQPALATDTGPGPYTEQPGETPSPGTDPEDPLVVGPIPGNPAVPVDPPLVPAEPVPSPDPAPVPAPDPVQPPVEPAVTPVLPPAVAPIVPVIPPAVPTTPLEQVPTYADADPNLFLEPAVPAEPEPSATAPPTPSSAPVATKTAAPPVVSADITGPLKVALAPVAENNPIVQGLTVLVLILLGAAYFRALRSKRVSRPRANGK